VEGSQESAVIWIGQPDALLITHFSQKHSGDSSSLLFRDFSVLFGFDQPRSGVNYAMVRSTAFSEGKRRMRMDILFPHHRMFVGYCPASSITAEFTVF
jgi:hypothetical protein